MFAKKKSEMNEAEIHEVNSLGQRIGIGTIATMTLVGFSLIVYTGARALFYNAPEEVQAAEEILVPEDILDDELFVYLPEEIEVEPIEPKLPPVDEIIQDDLVVEPEIEDNPVLLDEEPEEEPDELPENDGDSAEEVSGHQFPDSFIGYINTGGVFVRAEPVSGAMVYDQMMIFEQIEVINSRYSEDWMQVRIPGVNGPIIGYVFAEFISMETE